MFNLFYNLPSLKLASIDKFIMPVINLDMKRSYKELIGLKFADQLH